MQIPFVGGAYLSRSVNLDSQRCINLFPVLGESGTAKSVRALFGAPGTRLLCTLGGSGGVRGEHVPTDGGDSIVVRGSSVYRVTTGWVATLVGTIDSLSTPVDIKDNGTFAAIVTGPRGYWLELATNTLTPITDPAFYGSARVDHNNNSFIFDRPGTNQFYTTEPGGITFDALAFASAESNAEPIVSHLVNHGELILFKKTVTEIWNASGNTDFAYSRNGSAAIEQGCAATYSAVALDNTVFWLGQDKTGQGIVWRLNGYTPMRVSHDGIEFAMQGYSDISDAIGFAYQQEGHTFYMLTFPTGNTTWAYDVATKLWHERNYLMPATSTLQRHRANCMMFFGGQHVVGDWENGNLYALDLDYYTDNGDPMPAIRSSSILYDQDYNQIKVTSLQVDIEAGVGLQTGQGSNPLMMIRWSKDGGKTWTALKTMSMGAVGDYVARARKKRMGKARNWVFEISITDPVKRVILGASIDAVGSSL